jgi:hypothetical protein
MFFCSAIKEIVSRISKLMENEAAANQNKDSVILIAG